MQLQQLTPIKDHPYVSEIGVLCKELDYLLSQEKGNNSYSHAYNGIERNGIIDLLDKLNVFIPSNGRGCGCSPIVKVQKVYVYGMRSRTRVHFELKEVIADYDRMVKEGKSTGLFWKKKGGLNKTSPVRIFNALYSNNSEMTLKELMEELQLRDSYPLKRYALVPMKEAGYIIVNGKIVSLSEWTKTIWNDKKFDIWSEFKLSSCYIRMLYLNLNRIRRMEKIS